jgi:lipopolysaccharide transport system permease protein
MIRHLKTLYLHRELLWLWAGRETKVRYKQSFLGVVWAILQPLVLMIAFTAVFSLFVHIDTGDVPYPLFSFTALLAWTFLSTAISFAVPSMVNNMNLVTKIYFPREILPIASVAASFIDFLVASVLLVGVLAWYHVQLTGYVLWVPFIVVIQILLTLGIVIPASAMNVFYRDMRYVIPLGIQLWLYATPIIYPITVVPEAWRTLYALNPMVGIVDSYRRVILEGQPPVPEYLAISICISVALAVLGYVYFKRSEPLFADLI